MRIAAATTPEDLADCLALRRRVFIEEQNVPEAEEIDGRDGDCLHLLARDATGAPIGTARLLQIGDRVKIQRVAVLPAQRGTGLGADLMQHAMAEARRMGAATVTLGAQNHAIGFYERLGFVAEGPEFLDAGIPHRTMSRPA